METLAKFVLMSSKERKVYTMSEFEEMSHLERVDIHGTQLRMAVEELERASFEQLTKEAFYLHQAEALLDRIAFVAIIGASIDSE